MTKAEFLARLTHRLGYLPYDEVKRTVDFYREAIEDRMEDGMSERDAVAALGSIDDIVREIELNLPLSTVVKSRVEDAKARSKQTKSGAKIFFLILTSPIWFSLLIAALSIVLGLCVSLFAVAFSIGVVSVCFIVCGIGTAVLSLVLPYPGPAPRLMLAGLGLACAAVGLGLIPVNSILDRCLKGCFKYTGRVIKKAMIYGKEAAA